MLLEGIITVELDKETVTMVRIGKKVVADRREGVEII